MQLDFGTLLLSACARVQGAVLDTPAVLHWIPADFVARVTVALALLPASTGRVFHLTTHGPALRDVLRCMQAEGHTVNNMSKQVWRAKVLYRLQTCEEIRRNQFTARQYVVRVCMRACARVCARVCGILLFLFTLLLSCCLFNVTHRICIGQCVATQRAHSVPSARNAREL